MSTRCESCGKNRYRSYRSALHTLLRVAHRTGLALRIYHCPTGKGFHLTKQPKRDSP